MLDIGSEKWEDLKTKLDDEANELGADARFENVFLIDDFTASSYNLYSKIQKR